MNGLVRPLYRALLRRAKQYDKQPALKMLLTRDPAKDEATSPAEKIFEEKLAQFLGGDRYYRPAVPLPRTMASTVRDSFESSQENVGVSIDVGFHALKFLQKPLAHAITLPKPRNDKYISSIGDPKTSDKVYPLVAPVPGSFLISSPMMQDFRFRKKVVLLSSQDEEGFKGLILDDPMPQQSDAEQGKDNRNDDSSALPLTLGGLFENMNSFVSAKKEIPDTYWVLRLSIYFGGPCVDTELRILHCRPELGGKQLIPIPSLDSLKPAANEALSSSPSTTPRGDDNHHPPLPNPPEKKIARSVGRPRGSGKAKIAKGSEAVFVTRVQEILGMHTKKVSTDDVRVFLGHASWHPGQLEEEIQAGLWIVAHGPGNLFVGAKPAIKTKKGEVVRTPRCNLWEEMLERLGGEYAAYADLPEDFERWI